MAGLRRSHVTQQFDVVCLGGGVAGEAMAAGLRDSGLTLAVVFNLVLGASFGKLAARAAARQRAPEPVTTANGDYR